MKRGFSLQEFICAGLFVSNCTDIDLTSSESWFPLTSNDGGLNPGSTNSSVTCVLNIIYNLGLKDTRSDLAAFGFSSQEIVI